MGLEWPGNDKGCTTSSSNQILDLPLFGLGLCEATDHKFLDLQV